MTYINGAIIPVKAGEKAKFAESAKKMAGVFKEMGALDCVDAWGVDVPDGKVTDMKRAVAAEAGETIVYSWIIWPDKATSDAAMAKMRSDPRMASIDMPGDMRRMIFGGFEPLY
jgi:uncharacterized protein YbaA (DUF1428 family)